MPQQPEKKEETGPRSFAVVLQKIGDGDCHAQLSDELHLLAKSIAAQAKARMASVKGSLTLKITMAGDETGVVVLGYDITRKEPAPRRPASTFWIGKDGNLVDNNPKQIELGLRDVSRERREAKDVAGPAPAARDL